MMNTKTKTFDSILYVKRKFCIFYISSIMRFIPIEWIHQYFSYPVKLIAGELSSVFFNKGDALFAMTCSVTLQKISRKIFKKKIYLHNTIFNSFIL